MEIASDGDLYKKIGRHKRDGHYIKERQIWKIFIQSVKGLNAMHCINVMHRDLKSANIFLKDGEEVAKLGDMNVSKVCNSNGLNYTQTGTPYYASPEVWRDEPYDNKSDVWSLGCVIYELTTLKPPFQASDMNSLFKKILKGVIAPIPGHFSNDLRTMLASMLTVNSQKRLNTAELMQHPIFRAKDAKYYGPNSKLTNQTDTKTSVRKSSVPPIN